MKISPSYLQAKSLKTFLDNVNAANKNLDAKYKIEEIHVDVMDAKFVKNTGVNLEDIKQIKQNGYIADVHLMVEKPVEEKYIDKALEYGADIITIHAEIENAMESIKYIKEKSLALGKNVKVGISLKPDTDINVLESYINHIDRILVMSVEPGKGGQSFKEESLKKIENINAMLLKNSLKEKIQIEVDGGINSSNAFLLKEVLVDVIVCGSYLTNDSDISLEERIEKVLI